MKYIKPIVVFCNAFFLIWFTFFWLSVPYSFDDEPLLIRSFTALKNIVLHNTDKPKTSELLFINVAWDKQFTEKIDDFGIPVGNIAITDRAKLAKFLSIVNEDSLSYKFLLIDINFDIPSVNDSLLQSEFDRTNKYIVSFHKENNGTLTNPVFKLKLGLSDYLMGQGDYSLISGDDQYMKFHLIHNDSVKTTPLLMCEMIDGLSFEKGYFFNKINNNWVTNSFIMDFKIRNFELTESTDPYSKINLGELLYLPKEEILKLTKGRIVVLGDFEDRDIHDTFYGEMPGPLILVNTYLSIKNGENAVSIPFLLFLFISFFCISWIAFDKSYLELINSSPYYIKYSKMAGAFKGILGYFTYFVGIYVFCYFIFDKHLTVMILSLYMELLDKFVSFIKSKSSFFKKSFGINH